MKNREKRIEEDKNIIRNRFGEIGLPVEFGDISKIDNRVYSIYFPCKDVGEYVEKSRVVTHIIEEEFTHKNLSFFGKLNTDLIVDAQQYFVLDNLVIEGVRDSFYDYRTGASMPGITTGKIISVRRRDFILSDKHDKIIAYTEKGLYEPSNKTWAKLVYSMEGDVVKAVVTKPQDKEDETDINFCKIFGIKNYSLEKRLREK